ncbi:PAS domain S-box protein [uncultured Draconibacterium sp.]|uniref:PAS domain S-box protein n=1 Tax=uncultured Draconibacterium sp. TaxID=1573823 RepID=UPI0025E832EC|nr:PAS domain S-box protein [uncultured Draconibacterium sp.]
MDNTLLNQKIEQLERQVAELEQYSATYKNIYDSLTEAVYILDKTFAFIEINKGAERMYGFSREEFLGKTPADVAAPGKNDIEFILKELNAVFEDGEQRNFDFWALRKNGELFFKEVIANKGIYHGKTVLITTARDVTERKEWEQEITKFKSISDKAIHGNAIADLNGNLVYINDYFANIHGYTPEELIGKNLSVFHSEKKLSAVIELNNRLKNEGSFSNEEVWHVDREGKEFPMLMNGVVISDTNDNPMFIASTAIDIGNIKELKQEREMIFSLSVDMICTAGFDGYLRDLNPAWQKTLGWTKKELRAKPFIDFVHPDDREATLNKAENILHGEAAISFTNRYLTKSGDYKWLAWNTIPIPDKKIMMGIARDITEQKRAEDSLKESENKFRSLYDNAPLSYQSLNEDGCFIDVNPTWLSTLGYNREEVIGRCYAEFIHPEWVSHFQKNFPAFKKRGYVNDVQFKLRHKKGYFIDVSFEGCIGYNPDGSFKQTYCVFKDITHQKEAEQALVESEAKFKGVFENANIGMVLSDKNTKIIEANNEFLAMLEYSREEMLEMDITMYTFPDDLKKEQELLEKFRKGQIDSYRLEKRCISKSKKIIWIDLAVTAKRTADGDIDHFLGMVMDMTGYKKAQSDLIKAKEKAEEADRLKSAFLANMSHEIRTPMNGILGFAELLDQNNLTESQKQEYLGIIKKSGKRMLNTVNDIIDISKIDAGQVKIENTVFHVGDDIDLLYRFFKPEAEKKGLEFSLQSNIAAGSAWLKCDKTKLNSIFTNLIKNAIKFTDKGSINIKYTLTDNLFEFTVTDTGIGVPENRKEAIFNRFEQADIQDIKAREGSGLGLSIAKSYADLMGAKLSFQSKTAKGSSFTLRMPTIGRIINALNDDKQPDESELKSQTGLRILIAEDDDISFLHLSILLKDTASNIIRAKDGFEVVEMVKNTPDLDCILLDVKMPLQDGYEACRQIRKFNKRLPIIAQTAYALEGESKKAKEAGCSGYLSKPIHKTILFELLNELNIH